ncbi:MAG: DUF3450 domain-containing protein [Pseudomonadota bacterium]|nr:DUF3450 domain-containing protein [Pseudomonadota bacterium]
MERKSVFLLAGFLLVFCLGSVPVAFSASPYSRQKIDETVKETVVVQKETTTLQQAWEQERRELDDSTHALELEFKLLEARHLKLKGYCQQRRQEILRLETGLNDMAEIGIRLEPFLDEMVGRIGEFTAADLPFSAVERERRLADLGDALKSYDADLAEKLRRVMEVLKIEAGFGRGFEVSEEFLTLDGAETTVRMLRLGRVGLYYLSLDGDRGGWFNRVSKSWEPLSGASHDAVKDALRMTLKQRAFDLVCLPVVGGQP